MEQEEPLLHSITLFIFLVWCGVKSFVTAPCLQKTEGKPSNDQSNNRWVGNCSQGYSSRWHSWRGGKMNSLLRWRHRGPCFHSAIYSSSRARGQSCHSISFFFKLPISTSYWSAHGCSLRSISPFLFSTHCQTLTWEEQDINLVM